MDFETSRLFDLSGKVAVVTGAARGLGNAIGHGLAGAGASVILSDIRDPEGELTPAMDFYRADVTQAAEVKALVAAAVSRFGRLDVMVANAAIPGGARAEDETEEGWEAVMAVNAKGTFLSARATNAQAGARGASSISPPHFPSLAIRAHWPIAPAKGRSPK